MKFKKINRNKFIVRLEKGEKIIETLLNFCKDNNIDSGYIAGLGAIDEIQLAHFNINNKKYSNLTFNEPLEIANLHGNISTFNDEIIIHVHIVVSNDKMQAFAGHLKEAKISVTGEIIIIKSDEKIERKFNEETGLNLLDF